MWSEVSYIEDLGDKIRYKLRWPYSELVWLYCESFKEQESNPILPEHDDDDDVSLVFGLCLVLWLF